MVLKRRRRRYWPQLSATSARRIGVTLSCYEIRDRSKNPSPISKEEAESIRREYPFPPRLHDVGRTMSHGGNGLGNLTYHCAEANLGNRLTQNSSGRHRDFGCFLRQWVESLEPSVGAVAVPPLNSTFRQAIKQSVLP